MHVIAHRGASAYAPENTLAAFQLALQMGAKALEFDVHQTKDGELVVIHDANLKRVAGKSWRIKALTWPKLAPVDVGSWLSPEFSGERVPRLDDVFDLAGGRTELHLEIKNGSHIYPGIEKRVVSAVNRRGLAGRTIISSFDHKALHAVRALDKKLSLGYLLGWTPLAKAFREMDALRCYSLNLSVSQSKAAAVKEAHRRGFRVLVYTVKTRTQLERLEELGVDGVFANDPEIGFA